MELGITITIVLACILMEAFFSGCEIGMIAINDDSVAPILLQAKRCRQVDAKLREPLAEAVGKLDEISLKRTRLSGLHGVGLVVLSWFVQDVQKRQPIGDAIDCFTQHRRDRGACERQ